MKKKVLFSLLIETKFMFKQRLKWRFLYRYFLSFLLRAYNQ